MRSNCECDSSGCIPVKCAEHDLVQKAQAEPPAGEFTKSVREHLLKDNFELTTMNKQWCLEACDHLDAQQQEIERLTTENKDLRVDFRESSKVIKDQENKIDKLTAENKAQAERIAELEKRPDFTKGEHE